MPLARKERIPSITSSSRNDPNPGQHDALESQDAPTRNGDTRTLSREDSVGKDAPTCNTMHKVTRSTTCSNLHIIIPYLYNTPVRDVNIIPNRD